MIPSCQGDARFDDEEQAGYVADDLCRQGGEIWQAVRHKDHWHVLEVHGGPL
jgi:hypothetical protein